MSVNGDAAEQVVRLSLEGTEVVARLTGKAAEKIAIALIAAFKDTSKTKGKTRLTQMLKSGKLLKVYSVRQKDLKVLHEQAKRYGILYCVLNNKQAQKDPESEVDVFIRGDDDARFTRIITKFNFATTHRASYVEESQRSIEKGREKNDNPFDKNSPKEKDAPSRTSSQKEDSRSGSFESGATANRPSMKRKIERAKADYQKDVAEAASKIMEKVKEKGETR